MNLKVSEIQWLAEKIRKDEKKKQRDSAEAQIKKCGLRIQAQKLVAQYKKLPKWFQDEYCGYREVTVESVTQKLYERRFEKYQKQLKSFGDICIELRLNMKIYKNTEDLMASINPYES